MRFATLSLALLLAAPSLAQAPPEVYYPLDVGNVWIYTYDFDSGDAEPPITRLDEITGTETVGGVEYAVRRQCQVIPLGRAGDDCEPELVRIDENGDVVVRQPDGTELAERCALGAPDGAEVECPVEGGEPFPLMVQQSGGPTTVAIGYQLVEVEGVQTYDGSVDPPPSGFAVGVGPLAPTTFGGFSVFHYAYVGGVEYGLSPLGGLAWSYDPVAVGSVREYLLTQTGPDEPQRVDSPRSLVVDGETWTLRRTQALLPPDEFGTRLRTETRQLVRFDTASAELRALSPAGVESSVYPCPLDDFDPIGGSCTDAVQTGSGLVEITRGGETRYVAVGTFDSIAGTTHLAGGLGLVRQTYGGNDRTLSLTYADIGPLPSGDPIPFGTPLGAAFPTEIDPTPAHRFYPLSVGDEWHYETGAFGTPDLFERRRIVGTEFVDGETYATEELSRATPSAPTWEVVETRRVRVDSLSGFPVTDSGVRLSVCPLDEPVNVTSDYKNAVACAGELAQLAYRFVGAIEQDHGPTIPADTVRLFVNLSSADPVGITYYALDLGPVPAISSGPAYKHLAFARVQQEDGSVRTIGSPLLVDAGASPSTAPLAVRAAPNPTAGALRLAVTVPQAGALHAEAFDALGRLVWAHASDAAAGPSELAVDAGAWAPGVYVVRVQAGGEVATARVVRR